MSAAEVRKRTPRTLVKVLVALATVFSVFAIFAVWAERQALDTKDWVNTSGRLLENKQIREALANYAVDELYRNVDVEKELQDRLPPDFQQLSGPASSGLRQLAITGANDVLATSRFQGIWEKANRAAHEQLISVIEDRGKLASTSNGEVVLDLRQLIIEAANELGLGADLTKQLPPDVGELAILKSDQLGTAQTIAKLIHGLALVLSLLSLGLFALAVYLTKVERWITVLMVGFGLVVAGLVAIILREVAGSVVAGQLASESAEPAAEQAWSIGTSLLASIARSVILYGLVFVALAWLLSPHRSSVAARRTLAPILRDRWIWVSTLLGLVALIWVASGADSTRPLLTRLVLVAMAAAGVVALRRRAIAEAPDATFDWPQRVRARAKKIWEGRARERAEPEPEDRRLERLERLAALRERGALSDEEFEAEKRALREPHT